MTAVYNERMTVKFIFYIAAVLPACNIAAYSMQRIQYSVIFSCDELDMRDWLRGSIWLAYCSFPLASWGTFTLCCRGYHELQTRSREQKKL